MAEEGSAPGGVLSTRKEIPGKGRNRLARLVGSPVKYDAGKGELRLGAIAKKPSRKRA